MRPTASPIAFRGACLRPQAHPWVGVSWREGCGEVKTKSKSPERATAYRMFRATPSHGPPARARTLGGGQRSRPSGHASPSACAQTSARQATRLWSRRPRPIGRLHQRQKPNSTKKTNATRKPPDLPQSNKSNQKQNANITHKMRLAAQGGEAQATPPQTKRHKKPVDSPNGRGYRVTKWQRSNLGRSSWTHGEKSGTLCSRDVSRERSPEGGSRPQIPKAPGKASDERAYNTACTLWQTGTTDTQRDGWAELARQYPKSRPINGDLPLSGFQMFMKCNLYNIYVGYAINHRSPGRPERHPGRNDHNRYKQQHPAEPRHRLPRPVDPRPDRRIRDLRDAPHFTGPEKFHAIPPLHR